MRTLLLGWFFVALASAAEVRLPDACDGQVCLTEMRWKKGVVEHTLTGSISTPELIQSVDLVFSYGDGRQNGSIRLGLTDVKGKTPFSFKLFGGGLLTGGRFQWDQSSVRIEAAAIFDITSLEKEGVFCTFKSIGSRLKVTIQNNSEKDRVLSYGLLTLVSGGESLRLNGTHGKYADLEKPNPDSLILASASVAEEFIPIGSAKFTDGDWGEDWRMHLALVGKDPVLALPLSANGQMIIEKLPLEVKSARMASEAKVSK